MFGVFIAQDYFLFYVFWEIMLLPMYFLIGIWGGPRRREYAAIKFFLYTLAGSVLMLIAIVALRIDMGSIPGVTAPFSIPADDGAWPRQGYLTGSQPALGHGALLGHEASPPGCSGSCSSASPSRCRSFPFHTWLPDAHVQAPTPISVILAGILLKLGGYGMIRACFTIVPDGFNEYSYHPGRAWAA